MGNLCNDVFTFLHYSEKLALKNNCIKKPAFDEKN